jgi:hypothetical protein
MATEKLLDLMKVSSIFSDASAEAEYESETRRPPPRECDYRSYEVVC